jgi:exodeoxyribonuclease VIII
MIRDDLTNEQYHALDGISASDVKIVHAKSIAHWKNKRYKASPTLDIGTAIHAACLERDDLHNLVKRGPETRRGKAWTEAKEEADSIGAVLLTESDYDLAMAVAESVMMTPRVERMLNDPTCIKEQSIVNTCPHTGLTIKCRPDALLPERAVLDLKTTQDASPRGFAKSVRGFGYDLQAYFYLMAATELEGLGCQQFAFIAVEKEPPYAVAIHTLSMEYLKWAKNQVMLTLDQIKRAQDSGDFTTGWPEVNVIGKPAWLLDDASEAFA